MNASSPPRKQQIPVIVLAGFLGSGKTTLLNHLLRNRAGNRIGVIVNDFGAIEIDAMTVSGQVGSTVSLGNGCLCCAVDASELDTFLETLTGPAARLDVIVIEASGLAEPQELVRMILASENPHIVYGGLVEVVDAAEFDATRERHPEIDRHLAVADLVVLNKTDRAGNEEQTRVQDVIAAAAAPAAPGQPSSVPRTDASTRSCSSTRHFGRTARRRPGSSPSRICSGTGARRRRARAGTRTTCTPRTTACPSPRTCP